MHSAIRLAICNGTRACILVFTLLPIMKYIYMHILSLRTTATTMAAVRCHHRNAQRSRLKRSASALCAECVRRVAHPVNGGTATSTTTAATTTFTFQNFTSNAPTTTTTTASERRLVMIWARRDRMSPPSTHSTSYNLTWSGEMAQGAYAQSACGRPQFGDITTKPNSHLVLHSIRLLHICCAGAHCDNEEFSITPL